MGFEGALPASIEAEQAVLGAMLLDRDCLNTLMEQLHPEYFFNEHHREIYSAIQRLFRSGRPVDVVTVLGELVGIGVFTEDAGKRYLIALAEAVPSIRNASAYVQIIKDKYERRALITAAKEIANDAGDESNESSIVLDRAEQRIYEIAHQRAEQGLLPLREVMLAALDKLMLIEEDAEQFAGTPSGISSLDETICGLNRSDLIIIAARPGMGKTSFALNIARNVAVNSGRKVAFFSLEMTREQLALRILSSESGIQGKRLREGRLSREEWTAIADASVRLHNAPIFIDEHSNITVTEMKAKLRRMGDVGLVVIDYLQLMSTNNPNRVQEISEITRAMKIMAKELNVPVICLSQLNRMAEGRKEHLPMLSDLRDSGSIEQDADIVLMLYREDYYAGKDGQDVDMSKVQPGRAICVVAKNRHGDTRNIELHWSGETTRFTGVDEKREA